MKIDSAYFPIAQISDQYTFLIVVVTFAIYIVLQ
jgi:hypothetical protein